VTLEDVHRCLLGEIVERRSVHGLSLQCLFFSCSPGFRRLLPVLALDQRLR
jgi:hypothetical protein